MSSRLRLKFSLFFFPVVCQVLATPRDDLEESIDEIERFLHLRRRLNQYRAQMALINNDNRPLKDLFVPSKDESHSSMLFLQSRLTTFNLNILCCKLCSRPNFSETRRKIRICTSLCLSNLLTHWRVMASTPNSFDRVFFPSPYLLGRREKDAIKWIQDRRHYSSTYGEVKIRVFRLVSRKLVMLHDLQ
jgi:hypothetical protein